MPRTWKACAFLESSTCRRILAIMGKKPMEFYEGEEQAKRVDAVMRTLVTPTSKAPKPAPQEPPQSSAK